MSEQALSELSEADLRQQVVMPLMASMGFSGVFEWHGGSEELRKDVVGWKSGDFGERENVAVVAKATKASGSRAAGEVATQVAEAFSNSFLDPLTQEIQVVHRVWIVTNKRVPKSTRKQIYGLIPHDLRRHVRILDGEELWGEWKKRFPVQLPQVLADAQRRLGDLQLEYRTRVWIEPESAGFQLSEKYPGQLLDRPIEVRGEFRFPDTPEGLNRFKEVQSAFETGASVRVPGDYVEIQPIDVVDGLAQQLFGFEGTGTSWVEIGTVEGQHRAAVRITIETDDGHTAVLPYIEWRAEKVGSRQATLSNQAQAYPILVEFVHSKSETAGNLSFSLKPGPVSAPLLLELAWAQACFSQPCNVEVRMVETGIRLFHGRRNNPTSSSVNYKWIGLLSDLTELQERVKVPLYVPTESFTDDDKRTISKLRHLLRNNRLEGTWEEAVLWVPADQAHAALKWFASRTGLPLDIQEVQSIHLFGIVVPLGPVHRRREGAAIVNERDVLHALEGRPPAETLIEFHFEARGRNRMIETYLEWGPAEEDS